MNAPRRPTFWQRMVGARSNSGPDFGDMGTAFGLDATMSPVTDWNEAAALPVVEPGAARSANPAASMDEYERLRDQVAPAGSGWLARLGMRSLRRT